ncbi:MAG TPA: sigma-70 family RNA polymerase sigma factor [Polyangiaceae bacterium]|nr:sigma-70 family RNA polymerase sigma factor [Polyangiaceae bacterium]
MSTRRSQASLALVGGGHPRPPSDAEVTDGLSAGEGWAVAAAWHRFAPMVLTMAERALGSRSEAEDIAQEVFCAVYRKASTLREPDKLRSFVYSFAIRMLKSELRRRKVRSWLSFHTPEALVDMSSRSLDVESRDLLRRFYGVLERLSPRDRLVFTLRHMESMTIEEVASTMNLSISTVKRSAKHAETRLSRWCRADAGLAHLFEQKRWDP